MRVLIVAATAAEIAPLVESLGPLHDCGPRLRRAVAPRHEVDVLVTGVGMVATAVWCTRTLARETYDLALDFGVCGSFKPAFEPGSVVHVVRDRIAELGAEDGDRFLTIQQLGLLAEDEFPFERGQLINTSTIDLPVLRHLRAVDGITVNTVHGNETAIAQVTQRFAPDIETMEGAAFMYACLVQDVRFAQVRAVSNRVERRNRSAWRLAEAITRLGETSRQLLEQL